MTPVILRLCFPLCLPSALLLRYAGDQTYFDEIKQFYYRDEFSHQVQEWNRQRTLAIERSLTQFLYPQMAKELKSKLIAEAKESIVRVICLHAIHYYCITVMHRQSTQQNASTWIMFVNLQSKIFTKRSNHVCLSSVLTLELIMNSPLSISSRSPAVVGCITGSRWPLTGQISKLRKTMIWWMRVKAKAFGCWV